MQPKKRSKGLYWEAIVEGRPDGKRPSVSLGYLSETQVAIARERLEHAPEALFHAAKAVVKRWALNREADKVESYLAEQDALNAAQRRAETEAAVAAGDYSEMTLRDFYTTVWSPVRKFSNPATWKREDQSRWPHILKHLGSTRLVDLSEAKWLGFLTAMTKLPRAPNDPDSEPRWHNASWHKAQNEYKLLLRKAKACGAIKQVHELPPVPRGRKREPDPPDAEEVLGIIECASSMLHQAL